MEVTRSPSPSSPHARYARLLLCALVKAIEHEWPKNTERINYEILRKWISGTGLPATWPIFMQVLQDIGLSVLANEMHVHIQILCPGDDYCVNLNRY